MAAIAPTAADAKPKLLDTSETGSLEEAANARLLWQPATWSPHPARDGENWAGCRRRDAALDAVARRIAMRRVGAQPPLDAGEINFGLRAAGEPHVWPRAWLLSGEELPEPAVLDRWAQFMSSFDEGGERRCGIAQARNRNGVTVVAALALDALADLSPLPTRARIGQWLPIAAKMLVPTRAAKVVALGPRSSPRTLPTSLHGDEVKAVCAVDRPGPWLFQIVADTGNGPRPVLEAMVFVDREPPMTYVEDAVPGEDAASGVSDAREAVERMLNAARRDEGLASLVRDARLDEIAQEQALRMRKSGKVAHDLGEGDPRERVLRAGLAVDRAGENLAAAATVQHAHRVLWSSPSHRDNLLQSTYDSVGIGVVADRQTVWVCEIFAYFGRAGIDGQSARTTR